MEFSLRGDGHMDIVQGFDDRDGVTARLVQEPKVAVTVDGGRKSVPLQAVPAPEDARRPQGICRASAAHMQASLCAAVWKVRESFSVAHVLTVVDTVHVHKANAVMDRDIHAKRILEVSHVPTHLANLLLDEDIPLRVLLRERFVLFRLLYVPKEHRHCAMRPVFEEERRHLFLTTSSTNKISSPAS